MTWAALWIVASALTTSTLLTGQFGPLVALPAALAWREARHQRWARVGAWCGIVVAAKVFALPVIVWLALDVRRRAGVASAAVTAAASVAAGASVFGWGAYAVWLRQFNGIDWLWAGMNASLTGWIARTLAPSPVFTPIAALPAAVLPVGTSLAVALLGMSILLAHRSDVDRAFALLWSGSLLASPLGWIYYAWIAVPAGLAMVRDRRLARGPLAVALVALLVPPYLVPEVKAWWWTVTVGSAYTIGLLAFWIAAATASCAEGGAGCVSDRRNA